MEFSQLGEEMITRIGMLGIGLASVLHVGCGESGPELVPASGSVTLDGKPLKNVIVTFFPQPTGPSSSGTVDVEGKFKLYGPGSKLGAIVGENKVTVVRNSGVGDDAPDAAPSTGSSSDPAKGKDMQAPKVDASKNLPDVYGDSTSTPLSVVVPAGGSSTLEVKLATE